MSPCSAFLLITIHFLSVKGLPTGAPAEACFDLSPSLTGHVSPPQPTATSPFHVDLSALSTGNGTFAYTPGEPYTGK